MWIDTAQSILAQDLLCQLDSVISAVVHNVGRALRVCFVVGRKWFCHACCVGLHVSTHFRRFPLRPRSSGTQVWSDVLEDLILPAESFALLAFLFLVALPFPEWLCPWLAAMFADAAAMLDVLFATLDAMMFFGWIFQLGYGFIARDCFQHFCGGEALPFMGSAPAATENDFGYELEIPDSVMSLELVWSMSSTS